MNAIRAFDTISVTDVPDVGGKGANLGEMARAGLPVPPGFVIATAGYDQFVRETGIAEQIVTVAGGVAPDDTASADRANATIAGLFASAPLPEDLADAIMQAYTSLVADGSDAVAVRSSATAEDLQGASFAGQQDTYLNIRGGEAVVGAVRDCWASLWTPRAIAYRMRQGIDPSDVSLAVVVQQLINAEAAGVMFTANPANGRRDETVIAAAWGLGESVVGGSVSTDNLVLRDRGGSCSVLQRDTADKEVMTIRTLEGTQEVPVDPRQRIAEVLTDDQAVELAAIGNQINDHYQAPMDIEWALADGQFFVVQARPVTALPDPIGDAPDDWSQVDPKSFYYRTSIVEMLPDPLTPLFGDMIESAVPESLSALFNGVQNLLQPDDLSFPRINGYAYYKYTGAGLLRVSLAAPALIWMAYRSSHGSAERRWRDEYHPRYQRIVADWKAKRPADLSATELLVGVQKLLFAACEYYTAVQMIIPVAATSELSFARLYDQTMRRPEDPPATTFVLGMDSQPMQAERALYDLACWCRDHPALMEALKRTEPATPDTDVRPDGVDDQVWAEWRSRLGAYLDHFGHTVYNLDFSNPVAADTPEPVLNTLRFYASRELDDPAIRQRRLAAEREQATLDLFDRLGPIRRRCTAKLLEVAQRYGPIRENGLADVGLAWPTIRILLRELGHRLVAVGFLATEEDVFWLHLEEVRRSVAALDAGESTLPGIGTGPADRRMRWRGEGSVTPPQILPKNRMNDFMERLMPSPAGGGSTGPVLKGLGASGGRVAGEACLITDPSQFGTMRPGMIIVAKITTPAYTPLFAMASAVVTDVGGPLSHSSIVAREYGIPAVLGTGTATQRIISGQQITVDGTNGTVVLDDQEDDQSEAIDDKVKHDGPRSWMISLSVAGAAVVAGAALLRRLRRSGHAGSDPALSG